MVQIPHVLLSPKHTHTHTLLSVDHTRVILKDVDSSVMGSDYINGNYISGEVPGSERRYIATQGCLPATVMDFWKMTWQENTRVIVMTTNEMERGRVSPCLSTVLLNFSEMYITPEGMCAFLEQGVCIR